MKNREIKFRAWDKIYKKLYYSRNLQQIRFDERYEPNYSIVLEGSGGLRNGKDIILIQYTGLKDYYEGDIHELKLNGTETHIEYQNAEIKWNNKIYGFVYYIAEKGSDYTWIALNDKNILKIKLLGNIYENPELIKT